MRAVGLGTLMKPLDRVVLVPWGRAAVAADQVGAERPAFGTELRPGVGRERLPLPGRDLEAEPLE